MKKIALSNVFVLIPLFALLSTGCSFVELKPEAETVKTLTADQVSDCKSLGTVTTKVIDEVLLVSRNEETMATELETLARNEAAISEGNAIVPISKVEEGRRTYRVYLCP